MKREWMESPVFEKAPFSQREAWVWMIEACAWKETTINVRGQPVDLARGQFSHSLRFMAERFGWTIDKVRYFISHLTKWGMCTTDNTTGQMVVTICNYLKYQDGKEDYTTTYTTPTPRSAPQSPHKEEYIKRNKEDLDSLSRQNEIDDHSPLKEAVEIYNNLAEELSLAKVQKLTKTRETKLRARLRDCGGLDGWRVAVEKIRRSAFLRGERNDFQANFDFMLQEKSFTKLMEGAYDDRTNGKTGPSNNSKTGRAYTAQESMLAGFLIAGADEPVSWG